MGVGGVVRRSELGSMIVPSAFVLVGSSFPFFLVSFNFVCNFFGILIY